MSSGSCCGGAQLAEAGPTLVELIRLSSAGFDPLVTLAQFAASNNLPMPRALQLAADAAGEPTESDDGGQWARARAR